MSPYIIFLIYLYYKPLCLSMGIFDFIKPKKKKSVKKASSKGKTRKPTGQKRLQTKATQNSLQTHQIPKKRANIVVIDPKIEAKTEIEDPLISISRQLTKIQDALEKSHTTIQTGMQSLRDDHHTIIERQVTPDNVAEAFENHKRELETEKTNIETELDILEIDQKILDSLKEKKLRSITVSEELNLSRQYTASRLSHLIDSGFVKRTKRGRSVYYSLITS